MKTIKVFIWLIAVLLVALFSCKDSEEVYDTGDYKYYLTIQSQVRLHLADNAEDESGMAVSPEIDRLSRTIFYMQQSVVNNDSVQGETLAKEAALIAVCDSLYQSYADMNPANKGNVICFVKLIRSRLHSDGTVKDAVTLKYYQFWFEKSGNGGGNGGQDSDDYLAKPDSLEAVDLGLSVLWANCNIGANQPRDYGARLAWGDPIGKLCSGQGIGWNGNGYTWSTDNYGGNNPPADIAETALDVVTANWGDGWHIPSYSEAKELCDQCQWKLRTWGDIKWYEVIGPNGNSIIMPLAGMFGDDVNSGKRFQAGPYGVGERGYYWTSSSCTTPSTAEQRSYGVNEGVVTAWCFKFNSIDGDELTPVFIDHLRAMHMSIRPVKNK